MLLWALAAAPACAPAAAMAASAGTTRPQVTLIANGIYDSNVTRLRGSASQLRPNLNPEDEIFQPTVVVNTGRQFGRQSVYFDGVISYDFYRRNTVLNSERLDLNGGFSAQIGPCQPSASAGYARRQSDIEDLQLTVTSNKEIRKRVSGTFTCARTIGFAPVFTVAQEWNDNTNPLRDRSDYNTTTYSGGLAYSRPTLGTVTAYGAIDDSEYPRRVVQTPGGVVLGDAFKVYSFGARYSRQIGARLQGDMAVSYTHLKPTLPGIPENKGVGYSFDLTYRVTGRMTVHGNFARTAGASNRANANYVINKNYGGDISYQLGPRILVSGGGGYSERDYEGSIVVGPIFLTHETNKSYFGSVRFNVSPKIGILVNAAHTRRDANLAQFSYSNTRVALSITSRL